MKIENIENEALNVFYISVKNDIDKWKKIYNTEYQSPIYNNYIFYVHTNDCTISIYNINKFGNKSEGVILLKYNKFNIKTLKARKIIKIIEKHFSQIEKNKELNIKISFIKKGINEINKNFTKEIRKEKLKKIN